MFDYYWGGLPTIDKNVMKGVYFQYGVYPEGSTNFWMVHRAGLDRFIRVNYLEFSIISDLLVSDSQGKFVPLDEFLRTDHGLSLTQTFMNWVSECESNKAGTSLKGKAPKNIYIFWGTEFGTFT